MRKKIELLIVRILGISTPEEERELADRLEPNRYAGRLLREIGDPDNYNRRQEILRHIDTEKELEQILRQQKPLRRLRPPYWQAAMIALLLGSALSWLLLREPSLPEQYVRGLHEIHPGIQGAVLVLGDGRTQELTDAEQEIVESDGSRITDDSAHLNYTRVTAATTDSPIYHRLIVGRGFEYMLTLQDGTKIWMNSESELHYPVQFPADSRRVKLTGEAYFEVAPDPGRPFRVEVDDRFRVEVLGTHFNIKAYPSDEWAETTLVSGKIAIDDRILQPSEQAVLYKDRETEIRKVNVSYYTAWHEGWFFFGNEQLEKALEQIGRWYDIDFHFDDEQLRGIPITGKLKRFDRLDIILGMLETTTGCQFELKGKEIYVSKRNNRK